MNRIAVSLLSLAVLVAGCVVAPTPVPQQQTGKTVVSVVPAKGFVDAWFKVYLDALTDLTLTRGSWGVNDKGERVWIEPQFGLSRIPRLHGHNVSQATEYLGGFDKLRKLLDESQFFGQSWGFGARTAPLKADNMSMRFRQTSFPIDAPKIDPSVSEPILDFAKKALAKLDKGEIPTMKYREWDLQARLVRLTDKECLKCHVESKLNDPVAVFVFATKAK